MATVFATKEASEDLVVNAENTFDRPEIDRHDLRALLLQSIPSERVQWNSRVEKFERSDDDDGTISISLPGGRKEEGFRLVVGAEGAWSKARSLVSKFFSTS
jgi:2-polyprenyl-6-methoxyphenol hydroxylase-like FAD-dependent oxidoreductase